MRFSDDNVQYLDSYIYSRMTVHLILVNRLGGLSLPSNKDRQNRALETALCLPMGETREIFDLHFLAKPGFFQANYCDVKKVEVPNCVLACNIRNEFVAVRVYQAVKNPATTDEFAADFSFMPE